MHKNLSKNVLRNIQHGCQLLSAHRRLFRNEKVPANALSQGASREVFFLLPSLFVEQKLRELSFLLCVRKLTNRFEKIKYFSSRGLDPQRGLLCLFSRKNLHVEISDFTSRICTRILAEQIERKSYPERLLLAERPSLRYAHDKNTLCNQSIRPTSRMISCVCTLWTQSLTEIIGVSIENGAFIFATLNMRSFSFHAKELWRSPFLTP